MAISPEDVRFLSVEDNPSCYPGYVSFSLLGLIPETNAPCELFISACGRAAGGSRLLTMLESGRSIAAGLLEKLTREGLLIGYVKIEDLYMLQDYFRNSIREAAKMDCPASDKLDCLMYENTLCAIKAAILDPRNGKRLTAGALMVRNIVESLWRDKQTRRVLISLMIWNDLLYSHCLNVCVLGLNLMRTQGWEHREIDELSRAFLFYDIGMTTVPLSINEKVTPLSEEERQRIEAHPTASVELLKKVSGMTPSILGIVLSHHENLDGTGYPRKLSGTQLSPGARLLRIIDTYDAMTSPRANRLALKPEQALAMMTHEMSQKLDQKILKEFIASLGLT